MLRSKSGTGDQMDNYHHHARLTIVRREELAKRVLEGGLSLKEAEAEFKLNPQSAAKWVRRYREQGLAGLRDRSSRPHRSPRGTSREEFAEIVIPKIWLREDRKISRVATRLSMSPKKMRRILANTNMN
jgi:transposase